MIAKNASNVGEPVVGLIMGSDSDWATMSHAAEVLEALGIPCKAKVVSAHRTPHDLYAYATSAVDQGLSLIIAGAGGAAHLPGMTASMTTLPVLGVPVVSKSSPLNGLDAFLSIMQMPAEIGVATLGMGLEGAKNAGLLAGAILAHRDPALWPKLAQLSLRSAHLAKPPLAPKVAIIMGSEADWNFMQHGAQRLESLGIEYSKYFVSADRSENAAETVRQAEESGAGVFIVGSGNRFKLPAEIANETLFPVLGVPIVWDPVQNVEAFVQQIQDMPPGLATFAVGRAGAINAALFAAVILYEPGTIVWTGLDQMRQAQVIRVHEMQDSIPGKFK